MSSTCVALSEGRIDELPAPRPRKPLPYKDTVMLILQYHGELLLEKRPAPGLWGGLWCFPEIATHEDVESTCAQRFGASVDALERLPAVEHGFTHFHLTISPQRLRVRALAPRLTEPGYAWMAPAQAKAAAIPVPVRRILESLQRADA